MLVMVEGMEKQAMLVVMGDDMVEEVVVNKGMVDAVMRMRKRGPSNGVIKLFPDQGF